MQTQTTKEQVLEILEREIQLARKEATAARRNGDTEEAHNANTEVRTLERFKIRVEYEIPDE